MTIRRSKATATKIEPKKPNRYCVSVEGIMTIVIEADEFSYDDHYENTILTFRREMFDQGIAYIQEVAAFKKWDNVMLESAWIQE